MRAWVVFLGLLTFGAIMLGGGLAHRAPEDRLARWLTVAVGVGFMFLGGTGLILGNAKAVMAIPEHDKGKMLRFGAVLIVAGVFATLLSIVFPNPVTPGIAVWVKWVYTAGAVFVFLSGIAMVVAALSLE